MFVELMVVVRAGRVPVVEEELGDVDAGVGLGQGLGAGEVGDDSLDSELDREPEGEGEGDTAAGETGTGTAGVETTVTCNVSKPCTSSSAAAARDWVSWCIRGCSCGGLWSEFELGVDVELGELEESGELGFCFSSLLRPRA